ncbi:MAG: TIM barrel protein, partial [Opitutales bacterium]
MLRRDFLQAAGAATLVGAGTPSLAGAEKAPAALFRGKIYKSVKYGGRVNLKRLQALKNLGFDGVEGSGPGMDVEGLRKACAEMNMPMHGVVYNKHWKMRLSSPNPEVREIGRKGLEDAIRESKAVGGSSVLLVPGAVKGKDETHDHVWNRSITEIR